MTAGPPLDLPARAAKPREVGITALMDRGMSLAEVDGLMEVAGSAVDIVKLGFGTAAATENLEAKLERWRRHDVPVVLGGTLTEIAILQGRVDDYVAWVRSLGLDLIEVSDGSITLDHGDKTALIRRLVAEGFKVMSEVGSKDNAEIMAPYRWVEQIQAELEAEVADPARQLVDAALLDGELGDRAAEHDRHGVLAVALELRLEVLGGERGAEAELDDVDRRAGDLHEAVDLGQRQAAVHEVRDPLLARLGRARRKVEGQLGHRVGGAADQPCCWSAPTITITRASSSSARTFWSICWTASLPTSMTFATSRACARWPSA